MQRPPPREGYPAELHGGRGFKLCDQPRRSDEFHALKRMPRITPGYRYISFHTGRPRSLAFRISLVSMPLIRMENSRYARW
ncbi:hypothetical protein, partial [Caballeronia sp. dw_19]|uniref:hypothetical protein n=1 Tax=Caballeronia sp. dw_19 TaxID=2719791 RepID=UPI001BD2BF86